MSNTNNANIYIKSNIQVIETEFPFMDRSYLSKIFEKNALKKIPKNFTLTPQQERMKTRFISCSFAYNKIVIQGVILKDDRCYSVIRCYKLATCNHSERGKCDELHEIENDNVS